MPVTLQVVPCLGRRLGQPTAGLPLPRHILSRSLSERVMGCHVNSSERERTSVISLLFYYFYCHELKRFVDASISRPKSNKLLRHVSTNRSRPNKSDPWNSSTLAVIAQQAPSLIHTYGINMLLPMPVIVQQWTGLCQAPSPVWSLVSVLP